MTGVLLVADVAPGETLTHKMTVSVGDTADATNILVTVASIDQAIDGTLISGIG